MEHNTITDLADDIDDYCEKNGLEICTMNTITILQERGLLARQFPRKRKITTKQLEKIIELMRKS